MLSLSTVALLVLVKVQMTKDERFTVVRVAQTLLRLRRELMYFGQIPNDEQREASIQTMWQMTDTLSEDLCPMFKNVQKWASEEPKQLKEKKSPTGSK
ncbi:MAG TPA: hypothetical protein VME24_13580 [Alphaproteobacteria bacterium]|nr:hypothetical protein [Alphaproteobacteria bacterium]